MSSFLERECRIGSKKERDRWKGGNQIKGNFLKD